MTEQRFADSAHVRSRGPRIRFLLLYVLPVIRHRHPSRNSRSRAAQRHPRGLNTNEQVGKQGAACLASDDDEAFDPARFRVDLVDPAIEAIPAKKIDLGITNRVTGWFGAIPLAAAGFYPPQARLLILLAALCRLQTPDLEGGWYKLSTSRYSAVGLHDKDVRASVPPARRCGDRNAAYRRKTVHVRFTEMARLAHDIPFKRYRKLGVQIRQGTAGGL